MVHVVYILVSQDNSGVILWILAQIEKRKAYDYNKTNGDIATVKPFLKSLMQGPPLCPRAPLSTFCPCHAGLLVQAQGTACSLLFPLKGTRGPPAVHHALLLGPPRGPAMTR